MKKLLATLLAMVMALSLAVPAFADGPDGPPSLDDDIYGWTAEDEWGFVCETYPEEVAVFRKEVNTWFAQHTHWYDASTLDEFIENTGGEEAAYLSLFFDWKGERDEEQVRDERIKALGGVPGQVGVMVNGRYVKFPDAAPEVTGGRVMAPVRALIETMGGEVSTYGSDIRCRLDHVSVIFTVGSKEAVVELDTGTGEGCEQEAGVIDMDCAPYIKGGRTYVPVRFIGETLGYEVDWDSAYETVVLMDPEALGAEINERFTILNRALANTARTVEKGKNYRYDQKCDMTFTAFDTLNGNTTYQAGFTGKELLNSEADNGSYTITMSDSVKDALMEAVVGGDWAEAGEDAELLRAILEGLHDIEIIVAKEGLYWIHAPALDKLGGEENIWCAVPVDPDAIKAAFAGKEAATVGQQVAMSMYSTSYVMAWSDAMATADELAAVVGDACFTTSGGVSTLKWDLDTLIDWTLRDYPPELLDEIDAAGLRQEAAKQFKEFEMTLSVDSKGETKLSCLVHTLPQYIGDTSARLSLEGALGSGRMSMTVDLHIANVGQLKLTLSSSRQESAGTPVGQPPEGANIVEAGELLGG